MFKVFSLSTTVGLLLSCHLIANEVLDEHSAIPSPFDRLVPLHHVLGEPQPGEWLYAHKELGQTYREYIACRPVKPTGRRRVIFVRPLGDFTDPQRKIVQLTAEYLGIYFGLPVKIQKDLPLTVVPAEARRTHPTWGDKQILSTYRCSRWRIALCIDATWAERTVAMNQIASRWHSAHIAWQSCATARELIRSDDSRPSFDSIKRMGSVRNRNLPRSW